MTTSVETLLEAAIAAAEYAYCPYSDYSVGAALLCADDDTIYTGCNVENAAYPVTICAERTALVKAVSEGSHDFDMIAIATQNGGSPCGMCRQMLYEFSPDMRVICCDFDGKISIDTTLRDLLPHGFSPADL